MKETPSSGGTTMISQVTVEALHSATYVENYLDSVENLPDDVQRHLSRIREIDVLYRNHLRDVSVYYEQWSNSTNNGMANGGAGGSGGGGGGGSDSSSTTPATEPVNNNATKRAIARIQQGLIAAQELGDEKLQIVQQLQDMIDHKTRQLDQDFKNLGSDFFSRLDYNREEKVTEGQQKEIRSNSPGNACSPNNVNSSPAVYASATGNGQSTSGVGSNGGNGSPIESTLCGVRSYICRLNRSLIAMRSIYVARPPPAIKPADFECISYNRKRLVCQFQRDNSCGLYTEYNLSMIRLSSQSVCNLADNGTMLSFDSSSDTCVFSSGHRTLTFRIEGTNKIGKTQSTHLVDHFDIVRPEEPSDLQVSFADVTSVNLTWSMSFLLYNLNRSFEVEFHLITKHGVLQIFVDLSLSKDKEIMHHFKDLYAFTSYELRMRVRVIPKSERNFEEDYWSDWSSIEFQTKPCKPYEAPRILPGAYSFKERRGNLVTVEVYWEQVPEQRYNGPGFGYGIYALSQSGQKLSTNCSNNGVATFQRAKVDEQYTVYLYSYNEEGRSDDTNIIHIYPHNSKYQPKIKRMLYNESYQLQWFPVDERANLSNYTIMYCSYSTTGTCYGSIKFDTLPADATSYFLNVTKPLTFALAANYHTYSSELTWPLCTISPATSISQISFKLTDITEQSFTLRLQLSCMDQSLIDRYDVRYWPTLKRDAVRNRTYRPYDTVIPIEDLVIDTEYEVIVTAYDDRGKTFEASSSVRTKDKDILMQLALFLLFGMLVMGFITTTATRKVKKIMNIKVEIPSGLLGIYETPIQVNSFQEESEFQPISEGLELEELSHGENHQFIKKQNHCFPSNWEQSNQSPSQLPIDGVLVQVNTVQAKCRPVTENFINAMEMEELSPSEEQPFLKVKSILKKPEQICPPNHFEKPKPTVQIVTGDNYIKPSQMPCMMDPTEVMPPIVRENSSSGYVDVKLMRNQHQETPRSENTETC